MCQQLHMFQVHSHAPIIPYQQLQKHSWALYLFCCWNDVEALKKTLCSSGQHSNKKKNKFELPQ